jgi:pimeloyl-ACP methyl ester carboxylesterase
LPTDPAESLARVSIPGLWLFGRQDLSVPVSLSIERLDSLKSSGKRFFHTEFAGAGHQLPFTDALSASIEWLQRTVVSVPQADR